MPAACSYTLVPTPNEWGPSLISKGYRDSLKSSGNTLYSRGARGLQAQAQAEWWA